MPSQRLYYVPFTFHHVPSPLILCFSLFPFTSIFQSKGTTQSPLTLFPFTLFLQPKGNNPLSHIACSFFANFYNKKGTTSCTYQNFSVPLHPILACSLFLPTTAQREQPIHNSHEDIFEVQRRERKICALGDQRTTKSRTRSI